MALLSAAGEVFVDVLHDLQHMNKQICYNLFAVLLHVHNMFAMGSPARCSVSSPASSTTISFFCFATIAYFVRYKLSDESPVVCPASSTFLFISWVNHFCYTEAKSRFFFATRQQKGHVSARGPWGWKIKSPGKRPALSPSDGTPRCLLLPRVMRVYGTHRTPRSLSLSSIPILSLFTCREQPRWTKPW